MITKRIRIQLLVFSALGATAFALIFFHYLHIPRLMGIGQTRIEAHFTNGGGLYPNANVTYRGVTVGTVTGMKLSPNGAEADLSVASSAHVPRNVTATIKSVSAIGEQYVDLVPMPNPGDQVIANGDLIPVADTRVPVPIATVLDNVDMLVKSAPLGSLTTVLHEADLGFRNLAPSLAQLSADSQSLISAASANFPQTDRLIRDVGPVLDGQLASSDAIRTWAADLNGFSAKMAGSDAQLRALFQDVPAAARGVTQIFGDHSSQAPRLIATADVSAQLVKAYYPAVEQVLSVYPMVAAADIASDTPNHGRAFGLSFKTIANYPGGCSDGWPKAGQPYGSRASSVVTDEASAPNAYCRIAQSDPRVVRGARNLQCFEPGSPAGRRAALISQCSGSGYSANAAPFDSITVNNPVAPLGSAVLGMFDQTGSQRTITQPASWMGLLMTGRMQ